MKQLLEQGAAGMLINRQGIDPGAQPPQRQAEGEGRSRAHGQLPAEKLTKGHLRSSTLTLAPTFSMFLLFNYLNLVLTPTPEEGIKTLHQFNSVLSVSHLDILSLN